MSAMLMKRTNIWEVRLSTNKARYPSLSVALSSQDWQVYLMNELTVENLICLTLMVRLG